MAGISKEQFEMIAQLQTTSKLSKEQFENMAAEYDKQQVQKAPAVSASIRAESKEVKDRQKYWKNKNSGIEETDSAMAGGKDASKAQQAVDAAEGIVSSMLK